MGGNISEFPLVAWKTGKNQGKPEVDKLRPKSSHHLSHEDFCKQKTRK
jgi:hypothetical protein